MLCEFLLQIKHKLLSALHQSSWEHGRKNSLDVLRFVVIRGSELPLQQQHQKFTNFSFLGEASSLLLTINSQQQRTSNLQKGQEGKPRELQASQPHLHPGKGDGAAYPGGHHEASGRKEGYQEWSAWIHQGEIMPDQSNSFLQ